jgi:hypothetical protein
MSSPGIIGYVLAGYFVVLVGLSLARVVPVRLPAIQRLRACFPSFFDEVGVVPVLLARVAADEDALADGEWQPCLRPLPRRAGALPSGALLLQPESLRLSGRAYWHTTWASAQSAWS